MSFIGLYIILAGFTICVASTINSILNMKNIMKDPTSNSFNRHLSSMAATVVGGAISFIGGIWFIINLIQHYG